MKKVFITGATGEVGKYFKPLIDLAKTCSIQHILFLSVQGVENSLLLRILTSIILPHDRCYQVAAL